MARPWVMLLACHTSFAHVSAGSHHQPAGTWNDDTSMVLATCDSIRERGRIDVGDMRSRFEGWYQNGVYTARGLFDIGGTTA